MLRQRLMLRWTSLFTNRLPKGARRKRRKESVLSRRLAVETLEDRRMLAVITVDSLLDNFDPGAPTSDGVVTLREAITAANTNAVSGDAPAGSGADTILFDAALSGQTITLGGTELEITDTLTIDFSLGIGITSDSPDVLFGISLPWRGRF